MVRRNVSELFIFEVASIPKSMAYSDMNPYFSLSVSGEQLCTVGKAAAQGGRGGCQLLARMFRKESEA